MIWLTLAIFAACAGCFFLGALMATAAHADARQATMSRDGFNRLDRDVSRVVGPLSRN